MRLLAQVLWGGLRTVCGTCMGDVQKQSGGFHEVLNPMGPPGEVMWYRAPAFLQRFQASIEISLLEPKHDKTLKSKKKLSVNLCLNPEAVTKGRGVMI